MTETVAPAASRVSRCAEALTPTGAPVATTAALAVGVGRLAGCGGPAPNSIALTPGEGEMAGESLADRVRTAG